MKTGDNLRLCYFNNRGLAQGELHVRSLKRGRKYSAGARLSPCEKRDMTGT